jgi:phage-related protein
VQDVGVAVRRKRKVMELRRRLQQDTHVDDPVARQLEELGVDPLGDPLADVTMQPPLGPVDPEGLGNDGAPTDGAHGLPFRSQLEEALGVDLSFLQVEGGGAAKEKADALGAYAATIGGTVILPPGTDLFTVAHEVAHALQQVAGMGPSENEAASESHADAVAAKVVAGQDASGLLGSVAAGGSGEVAASAGASQGPVRLKEKPGQGAGVAVSEDGADGPSPDVMEEPEEEVEEAPGDAPSGGPEATGAAAEGEGPEDGGAPGGISDDDAVVELPAAPDLSGEKRAPSGGGGGGGAATLPTAAGTKSPEVTSAFQSMAPSQQSKQYKGMGGALKNAADSTSAETNEASPELHATLVAEADMETPPPIEIKSDTSASAGAVDDARNGQTPEHDEGHAPQAGKSPFRPSSIANWFDTQEGKDGKKAADVAITKAQAGGDGIPTSPTPPQLELVGAADPVQADDGAQKTQEEAAQAAADAAAAVITGPGPEVVQLKEMDVPYEAPQVEVASAPDFTDQVPGMDQFEDWDLPGDVQQEFDAQHGELIAGHVAEADAKVAEAQGDFESDRDSEISNVESQVAEAQASAQADQEKAVSEARQDIQDERQATVDKQQKAVADLNKQSKAEHQSVMSDIDARVTSDQGRVDKEMAAAQKEADAEVKKGQAQADKKAKEAEEEDDSFWGGVWDAIGDAISAITDAIVAVWDAVRDAVNAILDAVVELANKIIDAAISFVSEALGKFLDFLSAMVGELLGELFPELAAYLQEKLQEFKEYAQKKLEELGNWLKEQVKAFVDGLKAALNAFFDALIGALKFAAAFLEALVTGDWDKVLAMTIDAIFYLAGIDRAEFEEKYGSAEEVFKSVIEDPGKLITNAINALSLGFEQFGDNFWDHFMAGAVEWVTGATGVQMPAKFDLAGIFGLIADVLGLNKEKLKGKVEKHAGGKAAAVFDFAWDAISAMVSGGWDGLWEHLQGELSGLWDMVLSQLTEWIMEKALMRMAQFIATMATGFGAIVEAVIALWNFGTWLYDNITRIMSVVRTVLGSIIDFVAGNIQPAADKIESTLAKLIPVVLDLVAKMLGLGDIGKKARGIIEKVQDTVDKAVDKVIDKVIKTFKGGKDKKDDKKESDFDGEVGETVQFQSDGEGHKLWIKTEGKKATVMVASTPMPVTDRIKGWDEKLAKVGENGEGLAEGHTKGQVGALLSEAGKLAGVTLTEATEAIAAIEKEKQAASPPAQSADAADAEAEAAEGKLAAVLKKLFAAFGEAEDATAITAAETLKTENFAKFKVTMAEIGVDELGAQHIWIQIVEQLFAVEEDYLKTLDPATKRVKMADLAFQKLVSEFKVPKALDEAFDRQVGAMDGKRVALWSGPAAKDAAAQSGRTDVFLEGTPFGQAFDKAGLPKNVPSSWFLWASISKAYATKLAANVDKVTWVGFVAHDTVQSGNIAAEIEMPAVRDALAAHSKTVTWFGAATEDGKNWSGKKELKAADETLTKEPGFWDIGPDRAGVIGVSAAQWEKFKKAQGDGTALAITVPDEVRETPEGAKVTKLVASGDSATVETEASPLEPVPQKKKTILGWLKEKGEAVAKEVYDTAQSLLSGAEQAANTVSKLYKEAKEAVKEKKDAVVKSIGDTMDVVANKMRDVLITVGALTSGEKKSLDEILAGTEDLAQFSKALSERIRKQNQPIPADKLDDSQKALLLAEGRRMWQEAEGGGMGWMDDAVGAVGAAVKTKWKALKINAVEVANKEFTSADLEAFAALVASSYGKAGGAAGTFVATFDASVQAKGIEKFVNPRVNDEWTIKFGKFEHKVTPEGSEGEIPMGIGGSEGVELQKLLDPSIDIPLPGYPFVWAQVGNEEKELLADGAKLKYKHSRKETDKAYEHEFGGGGVYKGKLYEGKIFGAVHVGLPKMSLLKVALEGLASAEGEASAMIGLKRTVPKDGSKATTQLVSGEVNLKAELKGSIQLTVKVLEFVDKLLEKFKWLAGIVEAVKPEGELDKKRGGLLGKIGAKMDGLKMPELNLQLIGGTLGELTLGMKAEKIKDDETTAWKWTFNKPHFQSNLKKVLAEAFKSEATIDAMKEAAVEADAIAAEVDALKNASILAEKKADDAAGEEKDANKDVKKSEAELTQAQEPIKKAEQAEQDALDAETRAKAAIAKSDELHMVLGAAKKDPAIAEEMGFTLSELQKQADDAHDDAVAALSESGEARTLAQQAKQDAKGAPEAVQKAQAKVANAKTIAAKAKEKAEKARAEATEAKSKLDAKKKEIKDGKKDETEPDPEDNAKKLESITGSVKAKEGSHTAKLHKDGKNYLHSTPRPVAEVFAEAASLFESAQATPSLASVVANGEKLLGTARSLNGKVEAKGKVLVGGAEDAEAAASAAQAELAAAMGYLLDAIRAVKLALEQVAPEVGAAEPTTSAGGSSGEEGGTKSPSPILEYVGRAPPDPLPDGYEFYNQKSAVRRAKGKAGDPEYPQVYVDPSGKLRLGEEPPAGDSRQLKLNVLEERAELQAATGETEVDGKDLYGTDSEKTVSQTHHIVPAQLVKDDKLVKDAVALGYDVDRGSNGILLPETREGSIATKLPQHQGSHPQYTKSLRSVLEKAREEYYDEKYKKSPVALLGDLEQRVRTLIHSEGSKVSAAKAVKINDVLYTQRL